ncbi:c6 zinc finger domain-containing protein [Fusarium pseudocircinatum]|uniref:C6 zinc finger domain-containing protein n=1 Tax=Fusarium pseudocircinatum TaxID=56676 RepID=A0A8H5PST4_9HYPO|nr:c6 zinc finger domain-containing protein [Fusarium pseudocircinatum]
MSCPNTLPASWYTSKAIAGLERRAIFDKTWIYLGVVTRWSADGEDCFYDMRQFKFTVRRESEDWKSIQVLTSDGTQMRHHITRTGLLFITFSNSTPEFNEYFPGLEELISTVDFTAFPLRRSLKYTGKYNWKTLIDGFQECLHCSFAHPSFSKVYAPTTYKVLNEQHFSRHLAEADCKRDSPSDGLFLYFFPNSTLNLYGGGISSFRTWPTDDPSQTIMQFDYYHKSPVETEEFKNYYNFARTVATEDNDLCEMAQMNLNVGIYTEGILNPNKENGVIHSRRGQPRSDKPHIELRAFDLDEAELPIRRASNDHGVPSSLPSQSEFPPQDPVIPQSHTAQTPVDQGCRYEFFDYGTSFDDLSFEMSFDVTEDLDDLYEILAGPDSFDAQPVHHDTSQPACPIMPGGIITGPLNTKQSQPTYVNLVNDDTSLPPLLRTNTSHFVEGITDFKDFCRDVEFGETGTEDDGHSPPSPRSHPRSPVYKVPQLDSDSPENISVLFDRRICEVLCIKDSSTGNPWRKIVWPMAKEHTALYHAIAAMTCFQGFNDLPQHRAIGLRHLNYAVQQLAVMETSDCKPEATISTALAVSLAQAWCHPRSSTTTSYIRKGAELLRKALIEHQSSQRPRDELIGLGFLSNTWIYMDTITRITCHDGYVMDLPLMSDCSLFSSRSSGSTVDPLMGCARPLFPLLGSVADLVNRVRRRQERLNSPAIVSEAVRLRTSIERWEPSTELDEEPQDTQLSSSTIDLIQTANAYKWATLLFLHQAVPELPTQASLQDMARKVLTLIATVSVDSHAAIFPVMPLMIAGCEATDIEDRTWVSDRWRVLGSRLTSGLVNRCLEITTEAWKRHDKSSKATGIETVSSRPSSLTVKSEIHWMTIMKDWGWQVMLG